MKVRNLVQMLNQQAVERGDQRAFTFLEDGERESGVLTFSELDRRARAVAAVLQASAKPGDRALLLFEAGLDFLAGFFGCLYAKVIAVTAYPPSRSRLKKSLPRLKAISDDAKPAVILTSAHVASFAQTPVADFLNLQDLTWVEVDRVSDDAAEGWSEPRIEPRQLAFLQYTSGSTAVPKGVMVSHGNLIHNLSAMRRAFDLGPDDVAVTWLPSFHDLGLIEGLLNPIFVGCPVFLMSPAAFVQRPVRWLDAMTRYRGTHSGGPNFAFELCLRRVSPERRDQLDLGSWRTAYNGAEPIRESTLRRFAEFFAPCGFQKSYFFPCYGLAEATLMVTGRRGGAVVRGFSAELLEEKKVVEVAEGEPSARHLVSSGRVIGDQLVAIVDTETGRPSAEDEIGEIWVSGRSVAQGYWQRRDESEQVFRAQMAGAVEGRFLRTGDLGFLRQGELFVAGRLKDLIIVRGRNLYPQDLELTVERAHPALRPACGAAFSVEVGGEESLVVVQEVDRQFRSGEFDEILAAVRRALVEVHEVEVESVVLLRHGTLPRTSSGKVQRRACRAAYLVEELDTVAQWRRVHDQPSGRPAMGWLPCTRPSIVAWLRERLAERSAIDPSAVGPCASFAEFGLDSRAAVELSGWLSEAIGRKLPPTLVYDFPDIESLAGHLAGEEVPVSAAHAAAPGEPIAIIGIGCRLPGDANDPESFWRLLSTGVDATREIPADRVHRYPDPDAAVPSRGGFLDGVDLFDPAFFGLSPREAAAMDPQHRLLLEVAWEALEGAAQAPGALLGRRAGVFIGIGVDDYMKLQIKTGDSQRIDTYLGTGNAFCFSAGRLSYVLGLSGPSLALDTACSSSLVAVHLACQSLRLGECDLALAGGVNLILSPEIFLFLSRSRALSPDGRCRTFDSSADGYGRGEGCGLVVLKRLSDAIAARDPILAVIRGSAVNQDGRSSGLTVPNGMAQREVIRQALAQAGVEPATVDYVEAHGTGTSLGDPIEVGALAEVLGNGRSMDRKLRIGSVKTNIGHLEAAAGVTGLIKVALALRYGEIPPHLHLREVNPAIPLADLPLEIPTWLTAWPEAPDRRRTAGVSSFGLSGTNAHVIVEEAPPAPPRAPGPERSCHLLTLSARRLSTLRGLARRFAARLEDDPALSLGDVCCSANTGRAHLGHRLAVWGRAKEELRAALVAFAEGVEGRGTSGLALPGAPPRVAWVFPGSAVAGPGHSLFANQPTFRRAFERCDELLSPRLGRSLVEALWAAPEGSVAPLAAELAGPAAFALGVALAELWRSWGCSPTEVVGQGVAGRAAASWARGESSLEQAAKEASGPETGPLVVLDCDLLVVLGSPLARGEGEDVSGLRASLGRNGDDWAALLSVLAVLYVQGAAVDWEGFDRDYDRRRLPLPTTPFERRRCWLDLPVALPPAERNAWTDWLYEVVWEPRARPEGVAASGEGWWLLLADRGGVAAAMADLLTRQGARVEQFAPADLGQAMDRLRETGLPPCRGIVHLWSLDLPEPDLAGVAALGAGQELVCGSLLELVQVLHKRGAAPPPVWVVTRGAQAAGEGGVALAQAPVWGMAQVASLEHPEIGALRIDLDPGRQEGEAMELLAEILQPSDEAQVAFRRGRRLVARLARRRPPEPRPIPLSLRADAAYLITGGLGDLGLEIARRLVEHGARHLVLTSRSGLARQDSAVSELERLGVTVETAAADVTDAERMREVLSGLRFPLRGVIHAAGVSHPALLTETDAAALRAARLPKVEGAWILHELTREEALDFFVLFGSVSGVWGSAGLSHAAAGNHFLDALAHHRRALGLTAQSIDWGPWADVGMASREDQEQFRQLGLRPMSPAAASDAFLGLLGSSVAQVVVADVDWQRFCAVYEARRPRPLLERVARDMETTPASAEGEAPLLRRLAAVPPAEGLEVVASFLREEAARILGLSDGADVDPRQGFFDLGMDSLMAVELKGRIEAAAGRRLPASAVFDHPDVERLAAWLLSEVRPPRVASVPGTVPVAAAAPADAAIAIVGLGCRFPGAGSPDELWQLLRSGTDAVREVPADRWDVNALYDPDPDRPGKMYTRWGGFLDGVDRFDAPFFGISPREATALDPQQRLLLEVAWEALEHAGISPGRLSGTRSGVFVGITSSDYFHLQLRNGGELLLNPYLASGGSLNAAAGRLAYTLGLQGPALAVDTACSSSLVAVHLACRSLRLGESDLAFAGGVNLMLVPEITIGLCRARMLSPSGRCRTLDEGADGYVRGEGCGIVILKRLSDALADGDRVLAVIRGSAVNQDGRSSGLTAPNGLAQHEVVRAALADAGVEPGRVGCVELHGTGTPLGDPIEVEALTQALGPALAAAGRRAALGTVKTNIGHLESAAGIAGLIKAVLCLQHRELVPLLHLQRLNPHLRLDGSFFIPVAPQPWPEDGGPRVAGVSSFGFSGTNAHIVLEEAPATAPVRRSDAVEPRSEHLLVLSARSQSALVELARGYESWLGENPDVPVLDVCATANAGRSALTHRLAVRGRGIADLRERLASFSAGQQAEGVTPGEVRPGDRPRIAFLFTGQGAQYPGMGRSLHATQPVFREALERCASLLRPHLDRPLLEVLHGPPEATSLLGETAYTQPALFALEYALAEMWRSWGITPDAVLGHSVGEITAACVAGALDLEDAVELAAARGRLMQSLPRTGAMAVVRSEPEKVAARLAPWARQLAVAAINGPRQVTISGDRDALEAVLRDFEKEGVVFRRLEVSHAFHAPGIDPVLEELEAVAARLDLRSPSLRLISNLTGRALAPGEVPDAAYWRRHAREPVRFLEGVQALASEGIGIFVEVGPQPVLLGLAEACLPKGAFLGVPSLRRDADEWLRLLDSLARLWTRGCAVDWSAVDGPFGPRRVSLPTYPFERQRHWFSTPAQGVTMPASPSAPPARDDRESVLRQLRATVSRLLQVDPEAVDPRVPFLEMGADSLVMMDALRIVQDDFGVSVSMRQIFEDLPTVETLADYVVRQRPAAPPATPIPLLPTEAASGGDGLPELFAQQLRTIEQVVQKQLEILGARTASPAAAPPLRWALPPKTAAPPAAAAEPVQPFPRIDPGNRGGLEPRQQRHLDALIARHDRRNARTKELTQRYRPRLADNRSSAGFRFSIKEMLYPIIADRSRGSRIWDLDGNEYIDLAMGFGVNLFGYNAPFVVEAIQAQVARGMHLGPQSDLAGEVAELLCEATGMERAMFCNSGTEAVMTAIRVARAATGRSRVALFTGSYHGHFDGTLVRRQGEGQAAPMVPGVLPGFVEDLLVLDYGTPESLDLLREHAGELAAVLVEPVQSRRPDLQPRDFLHALRRLTREAGAALIFDEMITGFRCHPGGAQAWFGVQADLATYGKILGGGLPIGAVAGAAAFLDAIDGGAWQYGDDSYPRATTTFFAGTFCKHPLAMATARAVLRHLREQGPGLQERLNERTAGLAGQLNTWFEQEEVPIHIVSFSSLFRFAFKTNLDLLFYHLLEKGIHTWEGRNCFLSTAHTEEDIERVAQAVCESVREMRQGGFLPPRSGGGPPAGGSAPGEGSEPVAGTGSAQAATLPLTERQREIWSLSRLREEAAAAYHTTAVLRLFGPLEPVALERALRALVARHEALRTVIEPGGESQRLVPEASLELRAEELTTASDEERTAAVERWLAQAAGQPFAEGEPLLRVRLLRSEEWEHLLAFTLHQAIADGWSMGVLLEELGSLYTADFKGRPAALPGATPFREYVEWQEALLASDAAAAAESHWLERLAGPLPRLAVPTDRPRPAIASLAGDIHCLRIGKTFHDELVAWSGRQGNTLFMTLLAAFELFLHRLTGADDLIVLVPTEGQAVLGKSRLIGDCVNLLPLRGRITGDQTLTELLAEVRHGVLEAMSHQSFSFPRLLGKLRPTPDPSGWPLFNLDRAVRMPELGGLAVDLLPSPAHYSNFELNLNVLPVDGDLLLSLEYRTELFDRATIETWLRLYCELLRSFMPHPPSIRLSELFAPTEDEWREMLAARVAGGAPATDPARRAPGEPLTAQQEALARIWCDVLGIEEVGSGDSFFALGGHSLLAARLSLRVRETFGLDLTLRDLFEVPTLALMAEKIASVERRDRRAPIARIAPTAEPPLSFAQERHWFLHEMEPDSPLYNMGGAIRFRGRLDTAALEAAFHEILCRHEVLRATFFVGDGRLVQRIRERLAPGAPLVDLQAIAGAAREHELEQLLEREAKRLFDLGRGPLARLTLFRLAPAEHVATLVLHHIVSDGWSMGLLSRELLALYESFACGRTPRLSGPPLQYADFAAWQRQWLQGEELQEHLGFWRRELAGVVPGTFPADRPRGSAVTSRGGRHSLALPPDLAARLRDLSGSRGATLFMSLLSAFLILLHRFTRQDDLVVGAPVANRLAPGTEEVIGCFINVIAVRADLAGDPTFLELLGRVRGTVSAAFAHQEVPFEKVVEALNPERVPGRSPFFEVVFNLETDESAAPGLPGLDLVLEELDRGMPIKHDLTVYVRDAAEGLTLTFAYRLDLYEEATIVRIAEAYARLLRAVADEPEARLSRLQLVIEGERRSQMSMMKEQEDDSLKRLLGTRRRAIPAQESLVRTGELTPGQSLPLVISPATPGVDLSSWAASNKAVIEKQLLKHGGILFRGFDVDSVEAFHRFSGMLTSGLVNYVEGSSERIKVSDKVYTSTEYPPELFVSMHNELSYAHRWPKLIFFYCLVEPQQGGETPIADSRRVLDAMPAELKARFLEKGVQYLRNLHGGRGAGLSWQSVFETSDPDFVEAYCREGSIEFQWKPDGGLRTRQVRPGLARHPETGELIWFNQADQFHPSNLGEETARSLMSISAEEDLPLYSAYGDGTPFEPGTLDLVREAFRQTMVAFPWRKGDVLLLDNMLAAHGRMPFTGPRRIVVSMGDPVSLEQMPPVGSLDEPVRPAPEVQV